jgi:phospholipase/carboxylesterase
MDTATTTAAATVAGWPHLYSPGKPGAPVLLMLHGTGGNEHEIAALATELDPDAGVLAPRGPVTEHGMLRWFRRHGEGNFDVDDVITRAGDLAGFLSAAREHYSLGDPPVIAVGFSNGANIALATAMLHPHTLGNVIAFSGMYPFGDRESAADLAGSNLLILNGDTDPMAPLPSVTTLVTALASHGATIEQVLRHGGHGILNTDLTAARDWLTHHPTKQQTTPH